MCYFPNLENFYHKSDPLTFLANSTLPHVLVYRLFPVADAKITQSPNPTKILLKLRVAVP